MKKNLTALLQKGSLTAKERYLILIQNDVINATTGKKTLTEANRRVLVNWKAKTSNEAREWNKYNEGWKLGGRAGIEAEMIYWKTKADHLRKSFINMHLNLYPFYRDAKKLIEGLEKIAIVDINEAVKITNKQREQKLKDGVSFNGAVYQLAFESLNKDTQADLKLLYEEVEYETEYLDDEEIIADLFDNKVSLSKENKEKIADFVVNRAYNLFAKEYQLYHYYAGIPILEVAERFLVSKGINIKKIDENKPEKYRDILENYAKDNKTTTRDILKITCLEWLNNGLLIKKYTPLFNSEDKETYNEDTKQKHKEIFKEWLGAKAEAKDTLQKLINKGKLKTEKTGQDKIIMGKSLYNLKSDYRFIKDYKKRVDNYDAGLGLVYDKNDPKQKGQPKDRELLITTKNKRGELPFNFFSLTIKRLKSVFEATQFIKETEKDGKVILDFTSDVTKKAFQEIKGSLISGYTTLLAFRDIQKRLSRTYEVDLNYELNERVERVSKFIDDHNDAIKTATGKNNDQLTYWLYINNKKQSFKMQDNLLIDKDKLLPDIEILESWSKKFEDILGDDF